MFIVVVSVDLDKLLEDGDLTACASDSEAGGVMKVAVDGAVVLIIRVLRPKDGRTDGAGEMLDVKLLLCDSMNGGLVRFEVLARESCSKATPKAAPPLSKLYRPFEGYRKASKEEDVLS